MKKRSDNRGLLYCAIGTKYLKQAELSYQSCLKFNPKLKATLYTDQKDISAIWDSVLTPVHDYAITENNLMVHKLDAVLASPYEHTLYLDSDTFFLDDISELFELINRNFDLAFCHGHNRQKRYNLIINQDNLRKNKKMLNSRDIPYCFSVIQGGLLLYNKESTNVFFREVRDRYIRRNYFDDQAIIREILWESSIRFYILPPEYNFNSIDFIMKLKASDFKIAVPKIFHYTENKRDDIENLINQVYRSKRVADYKRKSASGYFKNKFISIYRKLRKANI